MESNPRAAPCPLRGHHRRPRRVLKKKARPADKPGWSSDWSLPYRHGSPGKEVLPIRGFSMEQNYYRLLGVGSKASTAEIRDAFRRQLRQCHPDTAEPGWSDPERLQALTAAYRILGSPGPRACYDQQLAAGRPRVRLWRQLRQQCRRWLRKLSKAQFAKAKEPLVSEESNRPLTGRPSQGFAFKQVLEARLRDRNSSYAVCGDGVIRRRVRPSRRQRPAPGTMLRSSWGVLLLAAWYGWRALQ